MPMRICILVLTAALLLLEPALFCQTGVPFNQRDDQYRLLGLKRAKEAFEVARADFERQKELFDKGLITAVDLERSRSYFADAEVNYQQSLLAVLFEEQYISVDEAVKYHSEDGSRHVRLTIVNTSGGSAEFRKLINIDDELFRSLQPDVINNVYVSILNDDGAIISQPYEAKVAELRYGSPAHIDFTLLQDLDAITIYMIYGSGSQRTMKVFLQKDATVNKVVVQSEQFSQEVDLGKTASFDLTLELFSGTNNTFSLKVANLPREISRSFKDESGRVRISQLKFTESTHTKRAELEISLPDRPSDAVVIDKSISFYVLVLSRENLTDLPDLETRQWTQSEIEELDVGYVRLELLPRGKGELLIRSPQLFYSIKPDESVHMSIEAVNEGSHRLDNVELKIDLPLNWSKEISPTSISSLEIGEDKRFNLTFTPPENISVGKYQLRLRTSAMSGNQPVNGEDKTVTIEIQTGTNLFAVIVIAFLIIGLVGGIVVFGIRLSRR